MNRKTRIEKTTKSRGVKPRSRGRNSGPAGEITSKALEPEVLDEEQSAAPDKEVLEAEEDLSLVGADALPVEVESELPIDLEHDIAGKRDVVPYDPLSIYLREISRYPHLTKEEEHALAVSYLNTQDREAAYKLLVSNLWLVVKIAREYERAARNLLDLIQEGNIGLIEAVKNFDPYRGVRFPSYAMWWVRAYIIRFLISNWRMVKIGTTQAQRKLFFNLKKEREKLEREGFVPSPKLLAEKLNVKEGEVIEMEQRLGSSDISVDAPINEDSENTMHALIPSNTATAEDALARKEIQERILQSFDEFSATLNPKEQVIFRNRMLDEDKATLQEISEKLSISRERVRQIENRIREKLKHFLSTKLGTDMSEYDL